ncbi:phage tail sheath family protein [Undibacterium sp. Ji50W]|uniref:phage tail sheath family protein n=1 Tax=Undibacterium sp. Ji50W TaxID=3413041 RepID=UPI003BF2968F
MSYVSPGVYVEEVPPLSRPIAGVGTSTPGFIGCLADDIYLPVRPSKPGENCLWAFHKVEAKENVPYLITSWPAYVQLFGDFIASAKSSTAVESSDPKTTDDARKAEYLKSSNYQPYLAHAVYGFFNNGGSRCYVVRVKPASTIDIDKAITALAALDEISTVVAPGLNKNAALKDYAQLYKRFAILDFVKDTKADGAKALISSLHNPNSAIYHPWLQVSDPAMTLVDPLTPENSLIYVPPGGHVAGVYARSDAERGVFKAPANEALLGIAGIQESITSNVQGDLNTAGVNVIRLMNGAYRIWGARTVGGDANGEFRYISTRRYMNYLRQSIDAGTQFVVFEPHTPALWQRVIRTLTDFLTNEWRSGALFGETAKQAFYVKCDADVNPPSQRELGQLVTEIGVAIVKPAEFVIFRIHQSSGG